jgi:hypothetical protein
MGRNQAELQMALTVKCTGINSFPFESKNAAYNTFVSLSVPRIPDIPFGRSSISQIA